MDSLLAARFPFLSDASAMAEENGVDIDSLLSSPSFEDARTRGADRVEEAIRSSEITYVPLVISEFDRLMEVMSYPYARMIVSCINDRFLTKRYALAESVRMNKILGTEQQSTVLYIAQSLGVNSTLDDDKLRMHFSDFLRFSTRIKSPEWKLINHEVYKGFVFLPHEKFDRLLQNALQDRIESELPLNVPDDFKKLLAKDIDRITMILSEMKQKYNPQFSGELKTEQLPPCIRTLLAGAQNGVNLPHSGRFALVSFLHTIGMNSDQILTLFSQSPDFDESKSIYQIKHITGELHGTDGYTPPECSTMKTNGLCPEQDELCSSGRINHPLFYYRIKSGTGRAPEKSEE